MAKKQISSPAVVINVPLVKTATVSIIDADVIEPKGSQSFESYIKIHFRLFQQEHTVKYYGDKTVEQLLDQAAILKVMYPGYSFEGDDGTVTLNKHAFKFERLHRQISKEALDNLKSIDSVNAELDKAQSAANPNITIDMFG